MQSLRRHLTYANIAATLALIAGVAGGTTALAGGPKAAKNSVIAKSIRAGNVTAPKLAGIRVATATTTASLAPVTARCAARERLLGGGAKSSGDAGPSSPRLLASHPDGNGWTAIGAATGSTTVTAYALCLRANAARK